MPTLRTSVRPPYAAYLRVYEPLTAFPEPERSYWQGYAEDRRDPAGEQRTALEEGRRRLADLIAVPPMAVPERESGDAFVHELDGVTYLCPWRTRLRSWIALEELQAALPAPLLDAVVPPVVRAQAEADWDRWRARHPDGRPWILTSTWNVPVSWFLLFDDGEREFVPALPQEAQQAQQPPEGAEPQGQGAGGVKRLSAPVLRYRTPMAQARRRFARGFRVLRENLDDGPLVEAVEEVGRWLEEFHPRSLVELDYGGLVHAVAEASLAEDHTARQVAAGVAALREGDALLAARSYRAITERWRRIQELQYAN
ncbi:hypothetical protein GXW83_32500 [Streptacidiphilus sp. PB12-B1b]|uniref:hypothetical protein n=1 Tax=Streptacidiphilus sp. PB12-B1b TaxID=2705012 RepID=UPI0015F9C588|nr:hypothetical protein [Streptacidiphilus sp. PB12-B1b]QMU79722.1 hypothetical protein GXW83_32500 [Streptacidiphilus sp. PB12-B1b]